MPYGTPTDPVAGTVITVAYAVANLLDPIRWLRQLTGNADPPGSNYVVRSTSTTGTTWSKVTSDTLDSGAALANLGYTPVNKAGDTMVGDLTMNASTLLKFGEQIAEKIRLYGALYGIGILANKLVLWRPSGGTPDVYVADDAAGTNAQLVWHDGNTTAKVTAAKLATDAVETAKIKDANVTEAKLASDAVTSSKILNDAVITAKLPNLAVTTAKIDDLAVTTAKLGNTAVNAGKLADDAVTSSKILNDAVTTGKINNLAVTTAKLDSLAVTDAKLASDAVTNSKILNDAVTSGKIQNLAVTTGKLADGAVTSAKILDGTITDSDVASANKDGSNSTPSLRTLGTGSSQAAAGNHSHTNPTNMCQIKTGTYTGDGGSTKSITGLGFPPKWLCVQRQSSGNSMGFLMTHDMAILLTSTVGYNSGNSLDADGFTVTSGSGMNQNTDSYRWVAIG